MFKAHTAGIGAALACVVLAAPTLSRADCKLLQVAEFKLDPKSASPIVDGSIDGRPVKVLIDSGATFSGISAYEVNKLGLTAVEMVGMRAYGVGGDTQVFRTHINQLQVGTLIKSGLDLFVSGDKHQDGVAVVIGEDVLSKVDTEFDLPDNAIRLFEPTGCSAPQLVYWGAAYSQADLLAWDIAAPAIQTHAFLNGKQVLAELDSGAGLSIVDVMAADADGVARPPAGAPTEAIRGEGRQLVQSWTGRFDTFAIGDEKISHVNIQVLPFVGGAAYAETGSKLPRRLENTPSMFIGDDFLRAHRVFIDNQDHLILFSYQGGPVFSTTQSAPSAK
jgi:predicted aspartyl protease